jgi:hypothetical protein
MCRYRGGQRSFLLRKSHIHVEGYALMQAGNAEFHYTQVTQIRRTDVTRIGGKVFPNPFKVSPPRQTITLVTFVAIVRAAKPGSPVGDGR